MIFPKFYKKLSHFNSVSRGFFLLPLLFKIVVASIKRTKDGNNTFFPASKFPWVKQLENNWRVIREELEPLLGEREAIPNFHDIEEQQYDLTHDDKWKTFFLYGYGLRYDKNCARCPNTVRLLLQSIPGMKTAMFSILEGKKHIPPHRGPYKGVLRLHLALVVPKPREACRIRVGKDVAIWEEGKCLILDDTFEHEAWNDSEDVRVVLFVDFLRPLMFPLSLLNRLVVWLISKTPHMQKAYQNLEKWEEKIRLLQDQKNVMSS